MKTEILCALAALLLCFSANAQETQISSPDGKIVLTIDNSSDLNYRITFNGETIVGRSPLGFEFIGEEPMTGGFVLTEKPVAGIMREEWTPVVKNKHAKVNSVWNGATLKLQETGDLRRKMDIEVKVFDEAVAFRYHLYDDHRLVTREISQEMTGFCLPDGAHAWVADYEGHVTSQEKEFFKTAVSSIKPETVVGLPLLVEAGPQKWLAITEAHIDNYPGFFIGAKDGCLQTMLSPVPGYENVKARFDDEITTPWRVVLIGDNPGQFIESEIIRTLNPPCAIEDTEWIKPGLCAWDHWWSGEVKMEMDVIKEYIDLASAQGWPYMLIDWQWYGPYNEAKADITRPAPQLDMPEILRYAKEKGVKIWLWLYSSDVNRNDAYKEAFRLYQKWGVAGIKIDFMDRQDQYMVNWYRRIIEEAAKCQLMVNFHGAYKPDGIERTWPNMVTREGVMGNEYNKWGTGITADHNVKLAFTRMLAGPMDYTPGGFLNVKAEEHKAQQPALVPNTRCAELSKFVIYESPLTVVCDHPDHIDGQAGSDFLKLVHTQWDEIKFIGGAPEEYIAMAKRSGEEWFLGVMNNSTKRSVTIDTSFLGDGCYVMTYWSDGKKPTDVVKKTVKIKSGKPITVNMNSAGGYVAVIQPE